MHPAPPPANPRTASLGRWLLRKLMPWVGIGSLAGAMIALLRHHHPASLRALAIAAAVILGLFSIAYFYGAARATGSGGYRWSGLERLGLAASGVGALLLALKLGFPDRLPGPAFAYLLAALVLAFIIRPLLESAGSTSRAR